jgi:hypothetical protein
VKFHLGKVRWELNREVTDVTTIGWCSWSKVLTKSSGACNTGPRCVVQAGHKLTIILLSECWDYRRAPPYPSSFTSCPKIKCHCTSGCSTELFDRGVEPGENDKHLFWVLHGSKWKFRI